MRMRAGQALTAGLMGMLVGAFVLSLMLAIGVLVLHFSTPSGAHEWFPTGCCAETDCRRAEPGEVVLETEGWRYVPRDELIKFDDPRIRYSDKAEGAAFVCTVDGVPTAYLRCLFPPEPEG